MNIYVGNLPYSSTEESLSELFGSYGNVDKVSLIKDKFTGKSKGFGFVEMSDQAQGQAAIDQLDGSSLEGRNIKVNEARPREERPRNDRRW